MAERYRFTLPDGRIAESDAGLAKIRKVHPDAIITHHIVTDDRGRFVTSEPFRGKSAVAKAVPDAETSAAPATVEVQGGASVLSKSAPATVVTRKSS